MNSDWLKTRQTKFTAYVIVYVAIVIGVLGLINFLANRHNKSVDTTSNKRFSLSDQTKKVVGGLKQDVKVTYFDKTTNFQTAKDLLDRYETLSPKLTVDYVDPDKKPQIARALGVQSYGSIFVETGGKRQEAKSMTEEEVTSAVIRALKGGERTVCFVSGSGEHNLDESGRTGYSGAKQLIEKNNYKTRVISLLEKPEVPKDCTMLVVAGPKFDYVPPVVNAIKTYEESGGRVLVLLDPPMKLGKDEVADNPELTKLLESWGVSADKDLVLDTSGMGQLVGLSEVVPLVATYETQPIVRDMKGTATAFPLARSLQVKAGEKTSVDKLFSTSENSFATANLSSPEIKLNPGKDKQGPFVLGAAGTYNTGQPSQQGRFVVVGSSGWISNNILRFNGNGDLLINILNWLSSDEDLISIRPKDPEDRRLNLTKRQLNTIFYSSVLLLPLAAIFAGVGVWWKRR